jgi:hypothetical protein
MMAEVAKSLCDAAGKSCSNVCSTCEQGADGKLVCAMWEAFTDEARAAILTAYKWHKKERRWPAFCTKGEA